MYQPKPNLQDGLTYGVYDTKEEKWINYVSCVDVVVSEVEIVKTYDSPTKKTLKTNIEILKLAAKYNITNCVIVPITVEKRGLFKRLVPDFTKAITALEVDKLRVASRPLRPPPQMTI